MNDYVAVAAARTATKRDPKNPYVVALEAQLDGLRRLEDPTNESPTAVAYREMLRAADDSARAASAVPRNGAGRAVDAGLTPAQAAAWRTGVTHGKIATYQGGCRCDECRAIAAEKQRQRRAAKRAS